MTVQPIPSWCSDNIGLGLYATRTQACETLTLGIEKAVQQSSGQWVVVGTADLVVASYQYTSYSVAVVAHQFGYSVTNIVGDVTGVFLSGSSDCYTTCTHVTGVLPATPVAIDGWHEAESFSEPPSTAVGSMYYFQTQWSLFLTLAASTLPPGTWSTDGYDARCDNAAGGSSPSAGCVVPWVPGVVTYSSSTHPSLAAHVSQAIASGLPGGSMAEPLHRTDVAATITANRAASCGSPPSISGLSCDEYPFASTYEGAASGGTARTFPGCSFTDPAATGPVGFSRCMINATENSSGGAILGNTYRQQRILEADPFWVRVL